MTKSPDDELLTQNTNNDAKGLGVRKRAFGIRKRAWRQLEKAGRQGHSEKGHWAPQEKGRALRPMKTS